MRVTANNIGSFTSFLSNNSSSLASTFASLKAKTSTLTRDSKGRLSLPTLAMLDTATTPTGKLGVIKQLTASLKTYTDAATQTGVVSRLSEMATQAGKVMDAFTAATDDLQKTGATKASQTTVSQTLTSLRGIMVQMGRLMTKLPSEQATAVKSQLSQMDTQAKTIANKMGLSYTSLFKTKGTSATSTTKAGTGINILA